MFRANYSTLLIHKCFILSICFLASSCTSIHSPEPLFLHWRSLLPQLEQLHIWKWQGQISVSSPDGRTTFQVSWQQRGEKNFEIHLFGPLAQKKALFRCDATICTLDTPQKNFSSRSPEELLHTYFGWNIPLEKVFFWLKGIPFPQERYEFTENAEGLLQTLEQGSWKIQYTEYHKDEKLRLPRKITLMHDTLRIQIVLNKWEIQT